MIKISEKTKLALFDKLKTTPNAFGSTVWINNDNYNKSIISFLENIWDLSSMKSFDLRYNDATDEFIQHLINNDDYTYDYLFKERLNLFNDEEKFIKFIELILSPQYRETIDEIDQYVYLINPYLEQENLSLTIEGYDVNYDDAPIYKITEKIDNNYPSNLKTNDIPFYVNKKPSGNSYLKTSHTPPATFPAFILVFNNKWNDYCIESSFNLFFYKTESDCENIGEVKIIYNNENNEAEYKTNHYIPDKFTTLEENFCSLGQTFGYYSSLESLLGKEFYSVLYALRDAAFFPDIHDDFENNYKFKKSLIRFDEPERLLRNAIYQIKGYDLSNLYNFTYKFQPTYSEETISVNFEFDNNRIIPNRIYALIGKNGVGKTQLISSLPCNISRKKDNLFSPKVPLFSKIIAVSYSMFDKFEIPQKSSNFNYHYCGIKKNKEEQYTERGLILRFHNAWKKIEKSGRMDKWRKILLTFIDETLVNLFLIKVGDDNDFLFDPTYTLDNKGFNQVKDQLSSGQAITLYVITEIVANIRYDSLIIYDEPEIHLHPNAITELMNTIYELVEEFESYCIIATHSPLVIRELFSKNVYIFERHQNTPSIRRIAIESFGENISVLTEEIFGNKETEKRYKTILTKLVNSRESYEEIISLLQFDEVPLSLNARIFIQSLINQKTNNQI